MNHEDKLVYDSESWSIQVRAQALRNPNVQNVPDKSVIYHILDEIQASVDKMRELLGEPKEDHPDNLDNSPFLHNSEKSDESEKAVFHYDGDMTYTQDILDTEHYPKSDDTPKPVKLPRYVAVRSNGTILTKGDSVTSFNHNEDWTFQSVTHPRKVFVTAKDDPDGPDSYPNMASREFYASVFDMGIWDTTRKIWTFTPDWTDRDIFLVGEALEG